MKFKDKFLHYKEWESKVFRVLDLGFSYLIKHNSHINYTVKKFLTDNKLLGQTFFIS